jgi:hypothetical protein
MYYHLYVANVHKDMTGSMSRNVSEATDHVVEKSVEQILSETKAMEASYEE